MTDGYTRTTSADSYHLTKVSGNRKTGPIPVTTHSRASCPASCPLLRSPGGVRGCYADGYPLSRHWDRVSRGERGTAWDRFLGLVRKAARGARRIRLMQAGDLPGDGATLDHGSCVDYARASSAGGRCEAFGYSHYPRTAENLATLRAMADRGATVSASCESLAEADRIMDAGVPAVAVVASDAPKHGHTPAGRRWIVCPAQLGDMTCAGCGGGKGALCWRADRDYVVAFRAHGAAFRRAEQAIR